MRLLVADMIRRVPKWQFAMFSVLLAAIWLLLGLKHQPSQSVAVSLALAFALGPFFIPVHAHTPLTPYLPLSRRDVWRAKWLIGAVAPAVVTTGLMMPGAIANGDLGWSGLTLSATMDFAYAGTGCALLAFGVLDSIGHVALHGARRWLGLPVILAFLGGPIWGYAARTALPIHWSDLTPRSALVLLAGLGCTAAAYFNTPSFALRGRRRAPSAAPARPMSAGAAGALAGLPRLIVHELTFTAGLGLFMLVVFAGIGLAADAFFGSVKSCDAFARSQALLVFDLHAVAARSRRYDPFDQLAWFALFAASVAARFPDAFRHLRVLPLGTYRLHALLLLWPALFWAAVWIFLVMLHVAVLGPAGVTTLRLTFLLFLIGTSALAQALLLRFWNTWIRSLFAAPMMIPFGMIADGGGTAWILVTLSIAALGVAGAVNVNAFARGSTYRRIPIGIVRTESI